MLLCMYIAQLDGVALKSSNIFLSYFLQLSYKNQARKLKSHQFLVFALMTYGLFPKSLSPLPGYIGFLLNLTETKYQIQS